MKKIILVLILILICGCQNNIDINEISTVCPSGAPSLALYNTDNFNTADAASILPELKGKNGSDVIIIDTINGIKALNAGSDYKLAATITFGNFYIASTGYDENGVMEDGDYIVLFSKDATPDLIFHYLYGNEYDSNIHYVNAVSDASACLIKGINITDDEKQLDEPYVDYVMIAEPALTASLAQNKNASIYKNIQEEYKNKTNDLSMIQASVFVSNKIDKEIVSEYLNKLENDINNLLANPELFAQTNSQYSDEQIKEIFGIPNVNIATKVLKNNSIGLGYIIAYDNKQAIDEYISIFGLDKTNEEIYFK